MSRHQKRKIELELVEKKKEDVNKPCDKCNRATQKKTCKYKDGSGRNLLSDDSL